VNNDEADAPEAAALDRLWDELADVARDTARLLVQPDHDSAELLALDLRAQALRNRIRDTQPRRSQTEPVDLRNGADWRGGSTLTSGG